MALPSMVITSGARCASTGMGLRGPVSHMGYASAPRPWAAFGPTIIHAFSFSKIVYCLKYSTNSFKLSKFIEIHS
jgi:hypothetical protein